MRRYIGLERDLFAVDSHIGTHTRDYFGWRPFNCMRPYIGLRRDFFVVETYVGTHTRIFFGEYVATQISEETCLL